MSLSFDAAFIKRKYSESELRVRFQKDWARRRHQKPEALELPDEPPEEFVRWLQGDL